MLIKTDLQQTYLTLPDEHLAEGEVDLGTGGQATESQVAAFVTILMQAALRGKGAGDPPPLSSLTLDRPAENLQGRLYGQAHVEERHGKGVTLKCYLFDEQGDRVLSGTAATRRRLPDQPARENH